MPEPETRKGGKVRGHPIDSDGDTGGWVSTFVKGLKAAPAGIAAGVIVLVCLARWAGVGEYLERLTYDARVRWALSPATPAATNLGFVYIDEATIRAVQDRSLGYRFGLYWPRQVYGRIVQELDDQGARAVALDVMFGELRPDHGLVAMADGGFLESDEYFGRQLARAGNVILAGTEEVVPPALFLTNAAAVGDISTDKDSDGKLRRVQAFRMYREWHPVFRQLDADADYGVDLRLARVERGGRGGKAESRRQEVETKDGDGAFGESALPGESGLPGKAGDEGRGAGVLVLPQGNGEEIRVPLDAEGRFALADLVGEKLPAGMAPKALPFVERRMWQMGIELAAQGMGLDLGQSVIDLERGRIVLRGPGGLERVLPVDGEGFFYINWALPPGDSRLVKRPAHVVLREQRERARVEKAESRKQKVETRDGDGAFGESGLPGEAEEDGGQRAEVGGQRSEDGVWQGRLVVVGSSAQGNDLTDRGATPLSKDALLVAKHWNVANSILTGDFVRRTPLGLDLVLIAGLGVLAALLTFKARAEVGTVLVLGLVGGYVAAAALVYSRTRWWVPVVLPAGGAMLMTHVCLVVWRVGFEQADKRRVRAIFSTIVSPKIVQELLQVERLGLKGARREISVMFADVRGFTALTEASQEQAAAQVRAGGLTGAAAEAAYDRQAEETFEMINRYLGLVADEVIRHDGTFDKFIGDCVMAFWGAPTPNPRHAVCCVRAAMAAQQAIARLNRERAAENERREVLNRERRKAEVGGQGGEKAESRKQKVETRDGDGAFGESALPGEAGEHGGQGAEGRGARDEGRELLPLLPLLALGTGINSGMATVGLMGAGAAETVRMGSYTVFGGEVNLAQRLESASGSGRIFISAATWGHLRRDDPELANRCVALEPVTVKGVREPVAVYEVPWGEGDVEKLKS